MRAVVQRVKNSKVSVDGKIVGEITSGMTVLLGVEDGDTQKDVEYMAEKITSLRIFEDSDSKMNLSLTDVNGQMLVISQFTLLGDCRKGRRPAFIKAAKPDLAKNLYEKFIEIVKDKGIVVETGIFQAEMLVDIANDGPVTLMLDSNKLF